MNASTERPIDQWFAHYSGDHQNATNQRIHVVAVPLILWSVIGLLWCIPVPGNWFRPGLWAALAMFLAFFTLVAAIITIVWGSRSLSRSNATLRRRALS